MVVAASLLGPRLPFHVANVRIVSVETMADRVVCIGSGFPDFFGNRRALSKVAQEWVLRWTINGVMRPAWGKSTATH